jgi:hypothetical protein
MPLCLYECKTGPVTFSEEGPLRGLQSIESVRALELNNKDWKQLQNKKFHNLYIS